MKIQGLIQTTCPIHITASGDFSPTSTEKNETAITVMPSFDPETGKISYIPGISPTHLRGGLRRVAHDIYLEEYARRGIKISADLFNCQRHGSANGALNREGLRPEDFLNQKADALMALMGGGPRMFAGALSAAPAPVICQETAKRPAFAAMLGHVDATQFPHAFRFIAKDTAFSKIDMLNGMDARDFVSDYLTAVEAFFSAQDERKVKKAAEISDAGDKKAGKGKGAAKADAEPTNYLRAANILTFQYLIPGVLLPLDIRCTDTSADHVKGFMIEVVRRYLEIGRVGGMQRVGFGLNAFNLETAAALTLDGEHLFYADGEKLAVLPGTKAASLYAGYEEWHSDDATWAGERLCRAAGVEMSRAMESAA